MQSVIKLFVERIISSYEGVLGTESVSLASHADWSVFVICMTIEFEATD